MLAPLVFVATAALCSQLAQTRRLATALSVGLLGGAFVIRMVADASEGSHWLLWATPLGWVELMAPFTANRLSPVIPAVVVTLVLGGLAAHNVVGGGLPGALSWTAVALGLACMGAAAVACALRVPRLTTPVPPVASRLPA